MYQIVYDFFNDTLFGGAPASTFEIGGVSYALGEWLSHSATILVLCVLAFTAFKFVWWLAKCVGNAFLLR